MVYVGTPPDDEFDLGYYRDAGYIDPHLPVAASGNDFSGEGFYTRVPSYTHCEPATRATYLNWLEHRESTQFSDKFVILYFIGLERRFFFDRSTRSEKLAIVAEAERLVNIYGYSAPTETTLWKFISIGKLILGLSQDVKPTKFRLQHPCYTAVIAAIGMQANDEKCLDGQLFFDWYVVETQFNVTVLRIFPEFKALFISLFNERYPKGMALPIPKDNMFTGYQTLSFNFLLDIKHYIGYVGDVTRDFMPYSVADDIAEEAVNSLEKFRRFLGKIPERRAQLAAHVLLPTQIRNQFPCEEADRISSWTRRRAHRHELVRFKEVVENVERVSVERITKAQTIKIIDKLAGLLIGLAPDPRFTMYNVKLDDKVLLYRLPESTASFNEISDEYWNTFRQLAVSCFVVYANSPMHVSRQVSLPSFTSNKKLTPAEQIRLTVHFVWMSKVPPVLQMLRQNVKVLPQSAKQELASVALSAAVVDGNVPPQRVESVKKIYKLLELDVADVYSDLHSHTVAEGPVVVRPESKTQQTFEIPAESEDRTEFRLDSERIDSVLDDTVRVSAVLGEVFADDEQSVEDIQHDNTEEIFLGLDNRHASLILELIQRNHWKDEEFEQLAGRFNLMPGGALETLNEWAFDKFDEPLMEEYDGYNLNHEVVEHLETR